ncbi:MAG: terpene cyclase/mutase family protein [Planctomycetaceae bacterium]|nr:terpene cyclase/mutase family protein [Planctomycetaceae bacterium]
MSSRSEKPDWFAKKQQSRARTGSSPQKPLKLRRTKSPRIKVHPDDLAPPKLSFWKDLIRDRKHGIRGLITSTILHIALLAILATIIITIQSQRDDYFFELGFTPTPVAAMENRPRGPIDVGAINLNPDSSEKRKPLDLPKDKTGSGEEENPDEKPPSEGVKPVNVKQMLSLRNPELRKEILEKHGGTISTEGTIKAALLWFKRQQGEGGSWQLHTGYPDAGEVTMKTETGATTLALLAFLGAGQTHVAGDHSETVKRGLDWLIHNQRESGNFHDRYDLGHQSTYYAHAQAVIVLSESLLLTGDESLREPTQKGIDYLLQGQNPTQGGWRYRPATELTVGDLSVTGWALMALHTARAAGFEIPDTHFVRAAEFLDSVSEKQGTRYKYMPSDPSESVSATMTAEGLLSRQFLGAAPDSLAMTAGVNWLLSPENEPQWKQGRRNVYEWYYTAQTLHNLGGENWHEWYQTVAREIVRSQTKTGSTRSGKDVRGTWDPLNPEGAYHEYATQAGRLYLTAMCVLILETPYRHAPLYSQP